jgi:hypothetical protein
LGGRGGEENVTHARVGAAPSMSEILPRLEEMRMTLEEGVERRGWRGGGTGFGRHGLGGECWIRSVPAHWEAGFGGWAGRRSLGRR